MDDVVVVVVVIVVLVFVVVVLVVSVTVDEDWVVDETVEVVAVEVVVVEVVTVVTVEVVLVAVVVVEVVEVSVVAVTVEVVEVVVVTVVVEVVVVVTVPKKGTDSEAVRRPFWSTATSNCPDRRGASSRRARLPLPIRTDGIAVNTKSPETPSIKSRYTPFVASRDISPFSTASGTLIDQDRPQLRACPHVWVAGDTDVNSAKQSRPPQPLG